MSDAAPVRLPSIGETAARTRTITADLVAAFADLSDDRNPVHLDEAYAAATPFKGRIAHGMIAGMLISAVLGNDLPGPGSIYLGQTLSFRAPVYIGDAITARVTVIAVRADKRIVTLATECVSQRGEVVVTGEAAIKVG
jgi:acyl dehydratase